MKRIWLFTFSIMLAFTIAFFSKKHASSITAKTDPHWKTFVKRSSNEVSTHQSTTVELYEARLSSSGPSRSIAGENKNGGEENYSEMLDKYLTRDQRVLIGDIHKRNYQDESTDLKMENIPNPNWKDLLGADLLKFYEDDTKVLIKEELPIIKVVDGKGHYLEQVMISYLFKDGGSSSYHALVNSETGAVIETWDRTVHENLKTQRAGFTMPVVDNSGITTH